MDALSDDVVARAVLRASARRVRMTDEEIKARDAECARRRLPHVEEMERRVESMLRAAGARRIGARLDRAFGRSGASIFSRVA